MALLRDDECTATKDALHVGIPLGLLVLNELCDAVEVVRLTEIPLDNANLLVESVVFNACFRAATALFDLSTVTTQLRGLRTVVYGGDDHEAHRAAFASLWFNKMCSFVDGGSATRNDELLMLGAICEARNGLSPPWTGVFYAVAAGDPRLAEMPPPSKMVR